MTNPQHLFLALLLLLITSACSQYENSPTQINNYRLKATVLAADSTDPGIEEEDEDEDEDDEFGDDLEDEFEEAEKAAGSDPLEGYNRFMTDVNDTIYIYALDPITDGYQAIIPKTGRRSVGNFFHNLLFPVRVASNLLQAKFESSGKETVRFVINSTVGILGLFDPARDWFGLERNDEDFGQALGYWGVGAGPHFVLPILGPSNARDIIGLVPETETDRLSQIEPLGVNLLAQGVRKVNSYSLENLRYSDIKKGNPDLYLFLKNFYEQYRMKKIKE